MVDSFNRQVLRHAVAQICQSMGWDALHKSTHDTLTDVMQRYLEEIGKVANNYTQLCSRTKPNLDDLHLAFQDTGVVLQELENFVAQVDPLQFIHPFTAYPKCQPCRLQHPSKGDIVDRAEFYSEHLPPLPKIYQEPTGEKEENPTTENNSVAGAEEAEKINSTPLKESNNVMDTSDNVAVKRRHEIGVLFPNDNKRSRLDIPANLILEKKENVENTDGESLSPATPVSPYLPQDLPKLTEEPVKPASTTKVKTEPKQLPNLTKEMVLPLKKLTPPPEKKVKSESSPSPKKPKTKKEKSISPNVQNKAALSSPKTDVLSPIKSPLSVKNSTAGKIKSPIKSPLSEKQVVKKTNKSNEHKASFLGSKGSPSTETSSKTFSKKPPQKPVVEAKKDLVSPKIKDREFNPAKKKKKTSVETDSGKSSRDAEKTKSVLSASTPKLMIKLPKSEQHSESPKYSPVKPKIITTPVKAKTPSSPSPTKAIGLKTKSFEGESTTKSEKKLKISGDSLEFAILKKEHSKKKKKKKDKDKDREKEKSVHKEKRKSEKIEPPIPKIRFKLDPSGESKTKTGESTTSSSKCGTSTGQSSSKKSSMVVIETENVRSSVLVETLSNNTLEYDPDRAYYCPVCHKQDDGSPMVGCDGCDEWCHWSCVGLMAAPPKHEKWYCPLCLLKKSKKKKAKSKKKS
ncbi:transcription initiation factor TFIID subunit 3-like [Dendronephthya gigantea]|uniref:transcription initiation factor TFIID subunit 3-like n=1 Tax=Dendronephthya gigantea TaxID=151771 RepID=UPI00106C7794|nr:transcription initiation factor TFIID subunit 3-like [Dendronephthya gigantea]